GRPAEDLLAATGDKTTVFAVGRIPLGPGRDVRVERGVVRGDALAIDRRDGRPVARAHRPDREIVDVARTSDDRRTSDVRRDLAWGRHPLRPLASTGQFPTTLPARAAANV